MNLWIFNHIMILISALAIKLDSTGPAFFRKMRQEMG